MKESVIKEIFYGEKIPHEMLLTKECRKLLSEAVDSDNELRAKLAELPELLKLYEMTNNLFIAYHGESEVTHYIDGFKRGLLMGLEITED